MKLREFLLLTTLISLGLANMKVEANNHLTAGFVESGEPEVETPAPAPSALVLEDSVLGSAYYDTLGILSTDNECSNFFGGPKASVEVFNQLMAHVRKDQDDRSVAMRMAGETVNIFNSATHREYRLFERVSINSNGPFYRRRFSNSEPSIPNVGTFDPNTKEVRVLILLHELAHLLKGITGNWLIPDDGNDSGQSRLNSLKIEKQCQVQLKGLRKSNSSSNLALQKRSQQLAGTIARIQR